MSRPKVLCVSFDETVSQLRVAALTEAGYDVTAVLTIPAALALPASFDLVVIGHRFDMKGKESLIARAREQNAKVILICGASNDPELKPHRRVYGLEGVYGIVSNAHELVPVAAHSD